MKRFVCFTFLLILLGACSQNNGNATISMQSSRDLRSCILTDENKPTENLKKLLAIFNIQHDGTFEDIVNKVQKAWSWPSVRTDDYFDFKKYESMKSELKPLFKNLGIIDSVEATSQNAYKYAVVASGWVGVTCKRITYLKEFWNKGIRFEKIVILTGQRDLVDGDWAAYEEYKIDKNLQCKTEYDLTKAVFGLLDLPEEMRKLPVIFVNTPKQKTEDGKWRLPYTKDQVQCWLEGNPDPGDCIAVINQPCVRTLENILRNELPKDFKVIDAVGYAINEKYETVRFWLETLSWWLNEEQLRLNKSQDK